jgi:hypothetical protein
MYSGAMPQAPTIQAALKGRPQSLVSGGEFLTIVRLPVKGQKNQTAKGEPVKRPGTFLFTD